MKPAPFAYADPADLDEALEIVAEHGDAAVLLAGGQTLVPDLNFRRIRPSLVVDLGRLEELRTIGPVDADGRQRVGAMVTVTDLAAAHPGTGLAEAVAQIGHPQIRHRSTIGGTMGVAEPAAELAVVAAALDAVIELRTIAGVRLVPAAQWFVGRRVTCRRPEELIASVSLRVPTGRSWWGEVSRRPSDLPIVGCYVAADEGGWRIAVGGVADVPVRAVAAERALAGIDAETPDPASIDEAVAALVAELDPPSDHLASAEHRRGLAGTLLRRALVGWGGGGDAVEVAA